MKSTTHLTKKFKECIEVEESLVMLSVMKCSGLVCEILRFAQDDRCGVNRLFKNVMNL